MKRIGVVALLLLMISGVVKAQTDYLPYSYQFYQKLNPELYSIQTREHTAIKSNYADDSLFKHKVDSVLNFGANGKNRNVLLNGHLLQSISGNNFFYADFMPDV